MKLRHLFLLSLTFMMLSCSKSPHRVGYHFDSPADVWEAAIPLGNGRIGMLPFGGVETDRIVLNEISLWRGHPYDADNPESGAYLPQIRELLFEGRSLEAQKLIEATFTCQGAGSAGSEYGWYETFGNLYLDFRGQEGEVSGYRRALDMNSGVATTAYAVGDTQYKRTYYTSMTEDVGVIDLSSSAGGAISFEARLERGAAASVHVEDGMVVMEGALTDGITPEGGMKFRGALKVSARGGEVSFTDSSVVVSGADAASLYISMLTSYPQLASKDDFYLEIGGRRLEGLSMKEAGEVQIANAAGQPAELMLKKHSKAFSRLFDRVEVVLPRNAASDLPIDKRVAAFQNDDTDGDLCALYMQYGRYLLISSTREGSLPPNLQGLWAPQLKAPWNGDYHLNINAQMNLWPAENGNLSELYMPMAELTESLVDPGTKTARTYYNASGWVTHMMTNVWGFTSPGQSPSWGATNTSGAWLCEHIWEHYLFTQDKDFLEGYYPVMYGAAEFFNDMLVENPHSGYLVTAPTTSPENSYFDFNNDKVYIAAGSTMDNQIVRELFTNTIAAAQVLGRENDALIYSIREKLPRIKPTSVGSLGQIMEWNEDFRESDPRHRHVSHLYGLYPGNELTWSKTPDLMEAARVTLERRTDESTGWSMAWKICFWARMQDGQRAFKLVHDLLHPASVGAATNYSNGGGTYANLFCAHPPMQIDGNFGGAAGIMEMLVQSHDGKVELIPAIPAQWGEGYVRGLRVRGGKQVEFSWKDGKVTRSKISKVKNN